MKNRRFLSDLIRYRVLVLILAGVFFSCTEAGSGSDDDENLPAVVGAQRDGVDLDDNDSATEGIQYRYHYLEPYPDSIIIILQLDGSVSYSDDILFKSTTPLPDHISLNEATGIITVGYYELPSGTTVNTDTVYFWSEGESSDEETSAQSLRIDFIAFDE